MNMIRQAGVIFSFFFFLCFNNYCQSQNNNLIEKVSFSPGFENTHTIKTISKVKFKELNNPRISYKNGVYWFKILLDSSALLKKSIVFDFKEPTIEEVSLFSNSSLLATRQISYGNTAISIQLDNPNSTHYFIKVLFKRQVHLPLTVIDSANFTNSKNSFFLKAGLYYGLSFMVFMVNLIFFISLKDRTYLYYACFLGMLNIAYCGFDGISYWVFSLENIDFYIIFSHYLLQVFGTFFAGKFLNLNKHQPKANKLGVTILILNASMYVLFFTTNNFLYCAIGDLIGVSILFYYWVLGVFTLKKEKFAIFFVIGYVIIIFVAIFFLIPLNFGLSFVSLSLTQLKIGALVEMFVLTYAITYRVKKMQQASIQIQFEIKEHLKHIFQLEKKLDSKDSANENLSQKIETLTETYNLTEREADVLQLISQGYNQKKIAESLFISLNTVKYHSRNLYEKLDVKSKTEITTKLLFN